ncbi:MAG: efflux RND transporter periplasmic adaptor subunit [Candidatus Campbellbacteria bacterium]|nr:efflux RND transporter periplasmic adaptor subunit [Candidatus Campbellbacteria bacterium]
MKKLKTFRKPKYLIPGLLILGVVIFLLMNTGRNQNTGIETRGLERTNVEQVITETGVVEPAQEVNLSFASSGRIFDIQVREGSAVEVGDLLMSFESSVEKSEVSSASAQVRAAQDALAETKSGAREVDAETTRAQVSSAQTAVDNAEESLDNTLENQDQLVKAARENFLSNDLQAYLTSGGKESGDDSHTPPTISGTYSGEESGSYTIELYQSGTQSGYSFRYSGLENGTAPVSSTRPVPLGQDGLYIEFPEDFVYTFGIEWTVPVPNTRSNTYQQKKNAYNSAVLTREKTVEQAEASLRTAEAQLEEALAQQEKTLAKATEAELSSSEASLAQARAALQRAEKSLTDADLTAPFSGVIEDISVSVGEVVSPGSRVATLFSEGRNIITVNVPEADIAFVEVGDEAEITFDAYDGVAVPAKVFSVAPTAKNVEGVTVVEVELEILDSEVNIKPGLSADVEIFTERREGVFAVPARAVISRDGETFVRVIESGSPKSIENIKLLSVETGLRGSDGMVEIKSGLSGSEEVVTFLEENLRSRVEEIEREE